MLNCQEMPRMDFEYYNNKYDRFYLYKRPDPVLHGETALKNFNECVAYVGLNQDTPISKSDPNRSARLHTCFNYCRNGAESFFAGDTRPNCVDLHPSERTSLVCLYPDETCEGSTVSNQVALNKSGSVSVAFTTGVLAVFIANVPQLIFEVLCILLMKKRVNTESAKENCSLLAFQFFMAVVVVYLLA